MLKVSSAKLISIIVTKYVSRTKNKTFKQEKSRVK